MSSSAVHTVYLNNLNERVNVDDLKKSLFSMMTKYGEILDVKCIKTLKMKGQAFIAFKDPECAKSAVSSLQGFPFYDKPIKISFARSESDVITKLNGTFVEKEKRQMTDYNMPANKRKKLHGTTDLGINFLQNQPAFIQLDSKLSMSDSHQPPNNILFLNSLPVDVTDETLTSLFSSFNGFVELRRIPNRPDIAFVEYSNEQYSSAAKDSLSGYKVMEDAKLNIHYARK